MRRDLGLHMLVKDEEELLPALLAHLMVWVSEIVVVDTGSLDKSREVVGDHGGFVYDYPLDMNFGRARNYGLGWMRSPWVLQVDADEWPTIDLLTWLEGFRHSPEAKTHKLIGARIRRENLVGGQPIGKNTYEWHTRMFRGWVRFHEVRIHESVAILPSSVIQAPASYLLLHHKTAERQERQNAFYEQWAEQRAVTGGRDAD